jgi:hypothetical protein
MNWHRVKQCRKHVLTWHEMTIQKDDVALDVWRMMSWCHPLIVESCTGTKTYLGIQDLRKNTTLHNLKGCMVRCWIWPHLRHMEWHMHGTCPNWDVTHGLIMVKHVDPDTWTSTQWVNLSDIIVPWNLDPFGYLGFGVSLLLHYLKKGYIQISEI